MWKNLALVLSLITGSFLLSKTLPATNLKENPTTDTEVTINLENQYQLRIQENNFFPLYQALTQWPLADRPSLKPLALWSGYLYLQYGSALFGLASLLIHIIIPGSCSKITTGQCIYTFEFYNPKTGQCCRKDNESICGGPFKTYEKEDEECTLMAHMITLSGNLMFLLVVPAVIELYKFLRIKFFPPFPAYENNFEWDKHLPEGISSTSQTALLILTFTGTMTQIYFNHLSSLGSELPQPN